MSTHTHTPPFAARDRAARGCAGCEVRVSFSIRLYALERSGVRDVSLVVSLYFTLYAAGARRITRSTAEFDSRKWASAAL